MKVENKKINSGESGNALFLILIAVALFAALSYAITTSGRGGGSVSAQTALITAGQVTEEPADVRSAATRMILTGVNGTNVTFTGAANSNDVFDQAHGGGGATNVPPPPAACNTTADCNAWTYVQAYPAGKGYYILGVGSTGVNGSDAMAILQGPDSATDGIPLQVCLAIDKGLGFPANATTSTPPILVGGVDMTTTANTSANATSTYAVGGNPFTIADTASSDGNVSGAPFLNNQDFACVKNTGGAYAYYGSLIDQ